uniref:Uncharacterized protein n=1 Tax=Physcomitrium patens TaxID=3218 RepID=A0A2K1KET5_PHYPA|nr:hypothetical protein PHYPA_008664 [Physcomitrium patens]
MAYLVKMFMELVSIMWRFLFGCCTLGFALTMDFCNKFVEDIRVVLKAREVDIGDVLIECYNYNQEMEVLLKTKVVLNKKQYANICQPLGSVIKVFEDLRACCNGRSEYKILF